MNSDIGLHLVWDTNDETWDNFLNSDINSSGDGELGEEGGDGGDDDKSGDKLPDSSTPSSQKSVAAADLMPPPLPPGENKSSEKEGSKKGKKSVRFELEKGDGEGSRSAEQGKVHIWTERERRKKMRTMFANLHALLPDLPAKADKSTIVDEAVNKIKSLEATLQKLEQQKKDRLNGVVVPIIHYDLSKMVAPPQIAPETTEAFLANQVSTNPNIDAFNPTSSSTPPPQFSPSFKPWTSKSLILNVNGLDAQICVSSNKKPCLLIGICFVLEKYKLDVVSAQISSDNSKSMYMIHTHACCSELLENVAVEEIYKQAMREITYIFNME